MVDVLLEFLTLLEMVVAFMFSSQHCDFHKKNESERLWVTVPLALLHPTTICFPTNNTCLFYISTAAFLIY